VGKDSSLVRMLLALRSGRRVRFLSEDTMLLLLQYIPP